MFPSHAHLPFALKCREYQMSKKGHILSGASRRLYYLGFQLSLIHAIGY